MENRQAGLAIWQAGVDAVRSDQLVRQCTYLREDTLSFAVPDGRPPTEGDSSVKIDRNRLNRLVVVGAGKAGAGMVTGLEQALEPAFGRRLSGWVNVPEDCVRPTKAIKLHGARPAGRNEPTQAGLEGSAEILRRVRQLDEHDLCLCLISGGGSALLPALREGVTLADLLHVTKTLSAAGATIQQLNSVRKRLSTIQGGQLVEACSAKHLIALIISDVMGDPLNFIASGPTVIEASEPAVRRALEVFDEFELEERGVRPELRKTIEAQLESTNASSRSPANTTQVTNLVIGNNHTAVMAAKQKAESLGFEVQVDGPQRSDMTAEEVGVALAQQLKQLERVANRSGRKQCFVSGGEPIVRLAPAASRGVGGRNQQLVLAALESLQREGSEASVLERSALLSGGTDGEDGPTDAAGGLIDHHVARQATKLSLNVSNHLQRNDAYPFLKQTDGLLRTGPTHTNVCDLRVVVVEPATI